MSTPAPVQIERTSAWHMYRAIVGIGAFCALIIVTVFVATADRIADNQARFLAEAVAEVLPLAITTVAVELDEAGRLVQAAETPAMPAFLGYNGAGELVGEPLGRFDGLSRVPDDGGAETRVDAQ